MIEMKDKIFILKQKNIIKNLKENHMINYLITESQSIISYPHSFKILNSNFVNNENVELKKTDFDILKKEVFRKLILEGNENVYVYFYGGINDIAKFPIELFPLFIIKNKDIEKWLALIQQPNFYCLKFFNISLSKMVDISSLDNNEEDILSISTGTKS
ncbi:hypothetical protein LVJ85_10470 [Neisseria sp. Dent CA1/247]|uniref:hypothetical protein n=1 Tax=Neisseria sp. Dent CA1/247 TaxID=2912675 RepID=UPI001FD56FDA|nr:hypothetical protein [Neisseria sp. Dent CA1/247]UOO76432.1 hypothetical protein LVJ85_10470 [Neisseria sp. Dent CA1/247]